MAHDELANALELARNFREENARLQRDNDDLRNQLETAVDQLYMYQQPAAVAPQVEYAPPQ